MLGVQLVRPKSKPAPRPLKCKPNDIVLDLLDRQTGREAGRQKGASETGKQTDRQPGRQIHIINHN